MMAHPKSSCRRSWN